MKLENSSFLLFISKKPYELNYYFMVLSTYLEVWQGVFLLFAVVKICQGHNVMCTSAYISVLKVKYFLSVHVKNFRW